MRRILFTVSNDLNYDQRMQRICTTLQREGYDVTIVGRKKRSSPVLASQPYKQARLNLLFEKGKMFYLELNIRLFFYLLFKRFDIVCGIDLDTILPCYFISGLRSKKCVYDAHELFTEVPEVIDRPAVRNAWLRIEKFICKRIQYAYTVSQSVADEFKRRYNTQFAVIRNLPYRVTTLTKQKNTEPIILYRGAVNKGRGLETAIEAMKDINAKLIIAGDGDIIEALKEQVQNSKLNDKVIFTGYQTPQQLDDWTLKATIGLNLLDATSKSYYYSLANKFLDYIQCGVPQIGMNFPEYKRINDEFHVALLLENAGSEGVKTAINSFLTDDKLRGEIVLNCTRASAELCWEKEEIKLVDFYKHL